MCLNCASLDSRLLYVQHPDGLAERRSTGFGDKSVERTGVAEYKIERRLSVRRRMGTMGKLGLRDGRQIGCLGLQASVRHIVAK
jgi:hypothetical protein